MIWITLFIHPYGNFGYKMNKGRFSHLIQENQKVYNHNVDDVGRGRLCVHDVFVLFDDVKVVPLFESTKFQILFFQSFFGGLGR
jgi:hypothetical protein